MKLLSANKLKNTKIHYIAFLFSLCLQLLLLLSAALTLVLADERAVYRPPTRSYSTPAAHQHQAKVK